MRREFKNENTLNVVDFHNNPPSACGASPLSKRGQGRSSCVWIYVVVLFLSAFAFRINAQDEYNRIGGWKAVQSEPKQFFYVQEIDGVWWIIDPAGNGFISKGVNHISYTADFAPSLALSPYQRTTDAKYGHGQAWSKAVAENLRSWNFNSVGAWSTQNMFHRQLAYTFILNIGTKAGGNWQTGVFPDVWSKDFERAVRRVAKLECKKLKDDIYLLGYFTDNELRWGPDWRKKTSLLQDYLALPKGSPGQTKALVFLKEKYGTAEKMGKAWDVKLETFLDIAENEKLPKSHARQNTEDAFLERIAKQYFKTCSEAIKEEDPNHLILGCRFAGYAPKPVLKAMSDYVDIISYNTYNFDAPKDTLNSIYKITGRPMMLTEFSFKAMDSGLPNTKGAGKPVETQANRAEHFTHFVTGLMELPFMVGYHWFEYTDEPKEGRFDGENSNYGLVNIKDEPYTVLVEEMTRTNAAVESIHAKSAK